MNLQETNHSLYQQAGQLYSQKSYRMAIGILYKLRNQQGFQIRAFRNIGACLFSLGRFESAKRILLRTVRINPADAISHVNLANTLCKLAELDWAEMHYRLALEQDPENFEILSSIGNVQILQKKSSEAITTLNHCLQLNPSHAESYYRLGIAFQANNNLQKAIISLKKAIELDPSLSRYHHSLGLVYCGIESRQEISLTCLERASEISKESTESLSAAGHSCLSSSNPKRALHYYQLAIERDPSNLTLQLDYLLVNPVIPQSRKEFNFFRRRCIQGLAKLRKTLLTFQRANTQLNSHLFFLAYQNNDNRKLLESYWCLVAHIFQIKPDRGGGSNALLDSALPQWTQANWIYLRLFLHPQQH